MKRKWMISLVAIVVVIATVMLCACNKGKDNGGGNTPQIYTIQYSDDSGLHIIDVESGALYSMESIPQRDGYEFLGLYDAKVGGTQYVDEDGNCLSAFKDNRNMVLYPQFKAKEYTLVLNYGEAAVTSARSVKVSYGQEIAELPTNLQVENKTFKGWYTEPNGEGDQIADAYGLLPNKAKVNEHNFDLSDPDGYIYLYAAFKGREYLVTFYIDGVREPEEQMIEYGTHVSKIVTETRNAEGKAVITWSKSSDKIEPFEGRITGEAVLYSMEFAPVIDFDANGGKAVTSIIAKQGASISLPTPSRENYEFVGWYTSGGQKYSATVMQADSVKLIAHWQAKLIFNTNGGTAVDNISEPVGTRIQLPTTSKDGFMFAGWYTEQGQEYTATAMPEFSVKLTAKYYTIIKTEFVIIGAEKTVGYSSAVTSPTISSASYAYKFDISAIYNNGVRNLKIIAHYKTLYKNSTAYKSHMAFYNGSQASAAYNVWQYDDSYSIPNEWSDKECSKSIKINSDLLFVCWWCDSASFSYDGRGAAWTDFWVEVEYPDMSRLY